MISFYLEVFLVHIDSSLGASHNTTSCVKFQDNNCRSKVEMIIETQKVYLSINYR